MKITKEKFDHLLSNPFTIFVWLLKFFPYFKFLKINNEIETITFSKWFNQKVLGINKHVYWPVHKSSKVVGVPNIIVGIGTYPGFQKNIYIQGTGELYFGDYTIIGQNSGILSGNHDIYNYKKLVPLKTKIGSYCWIGMNSIILGGVELGDRTIVAAGSVVTKSFPEGYCIIGGVPAKLIKKLDVNKVVNYTHDIKYNGFVKHAKFANFRAKNLNI